MLQAAPESLQTIRQSIHMADIINVPEDNLKKNHSMFFIQLRGDHLPDSPWEGQVTCRVGSDMSNGPVMATLFSERTSLASWPYPQHQKA